MIQEVHRDDKVSLRTTRCPIRIDGEVLKSPIGAPRIGAHDGEISEELSAES
jgi:CoA:oxalate CoA-transferase